MPKYRCTNKECLLFDKELDRSTTLKIEKGKIVDTGNKCPDCGKRCESVKFEGYCTTIHSFNVPNN